MSDAPSMSFACDAMCGGLARWLRALGYDTFYRAGVDDAELVQIARHESRVLITSDGKLLERRTIVGGQIAALHLPHGLKLLDQVRFVVAALSLRVHDEPRCMACNGRLLPAARDEVGDRVPVRSLLWATRFFRCDSCGNVYWDGSHWRRIETIRSQLAGEARRSDLPDTPRE